MYNDHFCIVHLCVYIVHYREFKINSKLTILCFCVLVSDFYKLYDWLSLSVNASKPLFVSLCTLKIGSSMYRSKLARFLWIIV